MNDAERLHILHTNLRNTKATILRLIERTLQHESQARAITLEIQRINALHRTYLTHNDAYERTIREFELNYWSYYYSLQDRDLALRQQTLADTFRDPSVYELHFEVYELESYDDISLQLDRHHFLELESRRAPDPHEYYQDEELTYL